MDAVDASMCNVQYVVSANNNVRNHIKTTYTLLTGPLSRARHFVSVARELKWHHSLIFYHFLHSFGQNYANWHEIQK